MIQQQAITKMDLIDKFLDFSPIEIIALSFVFALFYAIYKAFGLLRVFIVSKGNGAGSMRQSDRGERSGGDNSLLLSKLDDIKGASKEAHAQLSEKLDHKTVVIHEKIDATNIEVVKMGKNVARIEGHLSLKGNEDG